MSTYWGYVCESHDPPLTSEHWFNHGEDLLRGVYVEVRAGVWPERDGEPAPVDHEWSTREPIRWLREHPRCAVALHNEYGEREHLGNDEESA